MARPTVPHCYDCKHLSSYCYTQYCTVPRHNHKCLLIDRYMSGQEVRTSPTWCPLRYTFRRF